MGIESWIFLIACGIGVAVILFVQGIISPKLRAKRWGVKISTKEILELRLISPNRSDILLDGFFLMRREGIETSPRELKRLYESGPSLFLQSCAQLAVDRAKEIQNQTGYTTRD